jgi:hypothetical protein
MRTTMTLELAAEIKREAARSGRSFKGWNDLGTEPGAASSARQAGPSLGLASGASTPWKRMRWSLGRGTSGQAVHELQTSGRPADDLPVPGFPSVLVNSHTLSADHAEAPPAAAPCHNQLRRRRYRCPALGCGGVTTTCLLRIITLIPQ